MHREIYDRSPWRARQVALFARATHIGQSRQDPGPTGPLRTHPTISSIPRDACPLMPKRKRKDAAADGGDDDDDEKEDAAAAASSEAQKRQRIVQNKLAR